MPTGEGPPAGAAAVAQGAAAAPGDGAGPSGAATLADRGVPPLHAVNAAAAVGGDPLAHDDAAAAHVRQLLGIFTPLFLTAFKHDPASDRAKDLMVAGLLCQLLRDAGCFEVDMGSLKLPRKMEITELVDLTRTTPGPDAVSTDGINLFLVQLGVCGRLPGWLCPRFLRLVLCDKPPGTSKDTPPYFGRKWFYPTQADVPTRASDHVKQWRWAAQPF